MLVGEWGVTEEEYQSDSSSLSSAYNAIRRKVDVMFFLSHQEYGEAGVGTWGIRRWYTVPGEYHLQPDGGNPPGKTNLYGPYDTLVGS